MEKKKKSCLAMDSMDRPANGFTLMELSIALLVFLIGVLGLLQLVTFGISLNQRSRDTSLTTTLAQAKADELLRANFTNGSAAPELTIGGVLPTPNVNPLGAGSPATVACYTEFFDYDGNQLTTITQPCALTGQAVRPNGAYFVRQWQVWSCDSTCGAMTPCTAGCTANSPLRRITVTVTAMSPVFRGSYPSATVVVYKTRIG